MELDDFASACDPPSVIGPHNGRGNFPAPSCQKKKKKEPHGRSLRTESGNRPFSSAAMKTKGLKAEPGWRRASEARSNWLVA